ncbi:hypothetical protein BDE02_09G113400 [Populus trichocarpa]|jgi:hypothetical protein|nr:hypothetical protein BDE02_09G113400 [Populus trichocarpa]
MIGDRKTSFTRELARFLEFIDEFAVKRHETKRNKVRCSGENNVHVLHKVRMVQNFEKKSAESAVVMMEDKATNGNHSCHFATQRTECIIDIEYLIKLPDRREVP